MRIVATTSVTPVANRRDSPVWCCGVRSISHLCRSTRVGLLRGAVERVARNLRVPVHEGARGVVLPGPDVQRVEPWQPEPVRRLELLELLSHELGRGRVLLVPGIREHEIVGAGEAR